MADANERAKNNADEKAIRDKWYRENPRPVKQEAKPQAQQSVNMTGLTTPRVDTKFVLPEQPKVKVAENLPKPKPYMAMAVDKYGQGLYGEGLKGWARKAWADLTDPLKYFYDQKKLSQAQQDKITAEFEAGKTQAGAIIEDKLKWSKWGEKMFGITSTELGAIAPLGKAERDIAEQAGQSVAGTAVSRTARIAIDTTQNFIWGGLAVLGLGDEAMRKIHTARAGLDSVADRFNKDVEDTFAKKLISSNPISIAKDIYTVATAINAGKLKWSDTKEVISTYQAGSDMAYSLMFEEGLRAEFEKGLAEGKDPYLMAQDMGSIGIELAGSVLGDPTTYLGLSLVRPVNIFSQAGRESGNITKLLGKTFRVPWKTIYKIPEFGELIGATVGKARFAAEARFITNTTPEVERILGKANYISGDMDAAKLGNEAIDALLSHFSSDAVQTLDKAVIGKGANMITPIKALPKLKVWNMFALDTSSKINVVSRDTNFFLQRLLASQNGADQTFLVLKDMVDIRKGSREAAARLLSKGSEVFSPVGEMVGDILSKLENEKIFELVTKHADDRTELHAQLFKKLGSIVQDYVPSVDEMAAAVDKVKELKLTGKLPDDKTARFAEMYRDVPFAVKKVTQLTKGGRAVSGATSSAMVRMYMQFVPRSWSRNIQGAFLPMASRIGFLNALETAVTAGAGLNKGATTNILAKVDNALVEMIDFVPSEEGIAKMVSEGKGIFRFGMLGAIRRSEELMGRKIIEKAVRSHIQQALPAVVKNLSQWDDVVAALPKESQGLMFAAFQRAIGNIEKADKIVRNWIGKGEIEAWKLIEPSPALDDYLRTNDLWDVFENAREGSVSSDEFVKKITDILTNEKAEVKHLYNAQPILSDAFAKMDDFGVQLAESTPEAQREAIVGLYQSWHETQKALKNAVGTITSNVDRKVMAIVDPAERAQKFDALQVLKQDISAFDDFTETAWETVDDVRRPFVRQLKAAKTNEDFIELFNQVFQSGKVKFSLADIYKGADPRNFDGNASKNLAWSAFFEFASDTHKTANVRKYEGTMEKFNEIAGLFDSTIDDMAGGNTGGDNVFNVLHVQRQKAQEFQEMHAWERFFRQREFIKDADNTLDLASEARAYATAHPTWDGDVDKFVAQINERNTQSTNVALLANKYSIPTATRTGAPLDKMLLNIINKSVDSVDESEQAIKYSSLADVPPARAEAAFKAHAQKNNIQVPKAAVKPATVGAPVDLTDTGTQAFFDEAGNMVDPVAEKKALTLQEARDAFKQMKIGRPEHSQLPTEADIRFHALNGMEQDAKKWADAVANEWGRTQKTITPDQIPNFDELMSNLKKVIKPRMDHIKLEAAVTGVSTRNFALHDYNKTYMDHALTMLLGNSFHYWTTRTYARAIETLIENPKYGNMYMKYKEYNVKRHSDQPDWYRQNIQIDSLFGIELKNPYFMNLEAAVNPMYGLTGVDFNDPRKRVDWMTRTVDDMNKMGPTFSPLVSWGIGLAMFRKGEEEAGQRWFGRMLPQTSLIKEATSKFLGKPIELDPFVNFLEGGVDPYERNRVSAALANMVRTGEITQEQMIEAARLKEGDVWEAGIEAAATARFGSTATSFFFGAGLKPRTEEDMKIEKFWQDYSAMVSSSSMMTPEQYRQSWDKMRDNEEYGMYMDALLLSRKSGSAMDSAYAYNVFGRVPPGELNNILETVGIRPDLVQAFYDNKGDFTKMGLQPQDKERFMAGAIDIGAILSMPDAPTREAWAEAKDQYKQMNNVLVEQFGEGILELMSDYYNDPNPSVFLDDNPDVKAAMQYKDAIVTNNPSLMEYYGGISTMERYYTAIMERDLQKVYGENIRDVEAVYYDLLTTEEQKDFKKKHPELKQYWDSKKVYKDKLDRRIVVFGSNLPAQPAPQLRPDQPQNPNVPQENLQNLAQPKISWQQWQQELGKPMTDLIKDYWNGQKLPVPVKNKLDFEAEKYGYYDGDAFLQAILMSLQ